MIPRLICKLFGHKRREKYYTPEDIEIINGSRFHVDVWHWRENEVCPRCGQKLEK